MLMSEFKYLRVFHSWWSSDMLLEGFATHFNYTLFGFWTSHNMADPQSEHATWAEVWSKETKNKDGSP